MGIEDYKKDVMAQNTETNKEYRARLREEGTRIPTRNENLMKTKINRDNPIEVRERDEEMDCFAKRSARTEVKLQAQLVEIKGNARTFKARRAEYDRSRGAYESRTFLEASLRLEGIKPVKDIEGMKTQYEEGEVRTSGGELPKKPQPPATMVRAYSRDIEAAGAPVA